MYRRSGAVTGSVKTLFGRASFRNTSTGSVTKNRAEGGQAITSIFFAVLRLRSVTGKKRFPARTGTGGRSILHADLLYDDEQKKIYSFLSPV